ncbi:hypothetical protein HA402_006648 [Bradysia odoriphaga]|nr:hypothetical protein HA402_006648 [Bradysia odoriphaga]
MVVQPHRSYINRNLYENHWNHIHFMIERDRNGLSSNATNTSDIPTAPAYHEMQNNVNNSLDTCDIDQTLPAYHEIHNNVNNFPDTCHIDQTLPAYHEIHNSLPSRAFDETSLPSYESAVNWPVHREETSVPIPETLNAESTPNEAQPQRSCCLMCERMKHVGIAASVLFLCSLPILLIIFLVQR